MACDQPFNVVEKDEFVKLMTYACHPAHAIKLLSYEGIWQHMMKMGEEIIAGTHEMFETGV